MFMFTQREIKVQKTLSGHIMVKVRFNVPNSYDVIK